VSSDTVTLVFANDPLSPLALLLAAGVAGFICYYGYVSVRTAGRWRGTTLLALRALALATLGVILLQPSLLHHEPVSIALPDSFTQRQVEVLSQREQAAMLPPLSAIPVPAVEQSRDVRVAAISPPPLAFFKSRSAIRVTLANNAAPQQGEVVISRLTPEGIKELSRTPIELKQGRHDVAVELVPDTLGSTAYSVALRGFPQDDDRGNNSGLFSLLVVRDSLRILHIAGHPSWDVRFLRDFLTSLPGLELISFYLLVESEDFAPHSREELALIPFPTEELFIKEIGNFDLVIVHNFPLGTYFLLKEAHLRRLRQFVEEGGAVLFVGGDRALRAGKVHETPAAELLPVLLAPAAEAAPTYVDGPFKARLAPDGLAHPIMQQSGADGSEPFPLAGLPPLDGVNPVGEPERGGQVLAWAEADDLRWPLLVTGNYGAGRTLLIATDALWRWAFPASLDAGAPTVYRQLLINALGWLTQDPRRAEVTFIPGPERPLEGAEIPVEICIRGNAEPGSVAHLGAEWLDADGRQPSFRMTQEAELENSRCARLNLPPARPGAWTVTATVDAQRHEYTGRDVIVIARKGLSEQQLLAQRVAPILEHSFHPLDIDTRYPVNLEPNFRVLQKPVLETLWLSPIFFFAFALLLLAEWGLRRRWGYL
jgi:uncharacterized membrane protein